MSSAIVSKKTSWNCEFFHSNVNIITKFKQQSVEPVRIIISTIYKNTLLSLCMSPPPIPLL